MKVLMFGWEFPPYNSGGLGTACYGLTKGLSEAGVDVTFVLPHITTAQYDFLNVISSNMKRVKLRGIKSILNGYITSDEYCEKVKVMGEENPNFAVYGENLLEEVERYAKQAARIAGEEPHDIIHVHDWLTFRAGVEAKKVTGRPLIVHVHATEFDRTGGHGVNHDVYEIERTGMHAADAIIAVSNFTKGKIVEHYGVPADKVKVVHNGVELIPYPCEPVKRKKKMVLYLGRVTLQKGPDYFIEAAKKVLNVEPDATFVIAGSGDMERSVIEKAAQLGISDKVLFTGFLREGDVTKAYQMADLYVMPSVSEPFGLTPLEAAINKTPVLISKQSGVSEVFSNCLKVDFWDIDQMANKIIAVLKHRPLAESLTDNSFTEIQRMTWDKPAQQCCDVYRGILK